MTSAGRSLLLACLLLFLTVPPAAAYRPFVSTDAAVAEPKEMEIELGAFTLERTGRENTWTTPGLVLNYGLTKNWEAVAEFRVESSPDVNVTDPGLFLKGVLREGALQEKSGLSVAVEVGPLLPSTLPREKHVGFEGIVIVSAAVPPFALHVNGGGGVDRVDARPFGIWGIIGELAVLPGLRLVGEIAGEDARGARPNHSALLGLIWQVASAAWLDAGVRRGLTEGAPDWQVTAGVTLGFRLPGALSVHP